MDQQTNATATDANDSKEANPNGTLYSLVGTLTAVSHRVTKVRGGKPTNSGTPYLYAKLATRISNRATTMTVMAFGKAFDMVRDAATEGATIRFNGHFSKGDRGGTSFQVVGLGREPRSNGASEAAAA